MSRFRFAWIASGTALALGSFSACNHNSTSTPTTAASTAADSSVAVDTTDGEHPFVVMIEQRLDAMRTSAENGDWDNYQQYRTGSANQQMLERLAKMNVDLSINEMIKASAKHLKAPDDHLFIRCDAGLDGKSARICYETQASTHEGYWVLMFHLENGQWRLGDSGNTITTPSPDRQPLSLEAAIEDLGLKFPS